MGRKILRGLQVADFIHPDELKNKKKALNNKFVRNFLNSAADLITTAVDPVTLGTFVKIGEDSDKNLIRIVREVCETLDVAQVPDVYLCHLVCTTVIPLSSNFGAPYLVVPDYILRYSDAEMLYYNFGNAVTMIKADHVELTTLAAYMPGGGLIELPKILFNAYLHCADATSDRGGLLASQSFAATVRNHFWELGIPPAESRKFFANDDEAEIFVDNYLKEQQNILDNHSGIITRLARTGQRLTYLEAPANEMLRDLFNWYQNPKGYDAVISKYARR